MSGMPPDEILFVSRLSCLHKFCSENRTEQAGQVWILPGGDPVADLIAETATRRLASHRFVRWVKIGEGKQPTDLGAEELNKLLPGGIATDDVPSSEARCLDRGVDIVTYHEYAGIVTYHERRSIDMTLSEAERQARRREKLKTAGKILFQAWVSQDEAVRLKAVLDDGNVTYHAPPLSPAFRAARPAKRKRRRLDPVQEKNHEIFEQNIAKIRSRLAGGRKPSEIAAWLNSLGFVGSGATLNGLLNVRGIRRR